MPHFDEDGFDTWICQICGRAFGSNVKSEWRPDITGKPGAGNVCPNCLGKAPLQREAEKFAVEAFGISRSEALEKMICVRCHKKAGFFRDMLSVKEYGLSALCQKCQDEIFNPDEI